MSDRHDQIIERAKKSLTDDGFADIMVFDKQADGPGNYPSYFEYLLDRKLDGKGEPTPQELWTEMRKQINYAAKTIADAEKEYKKLFNSNFDLQRLYDDLLKGRP